MIARLRGTYAGAAGDAAIIDVGGVGYAVFAPTSLSFGLDEEVTLQISTQVREDAITLYGFSTAAERDAFDMLHSTSGVGPRTALAIMGHLSLDELHQALSDGNVTALTKVPGIGKKTAERLCLELKDKLPVTFVPRPGTPSAKRGPTDQLPLALAQLEYKKSEIDMALGSPDVPPLGEAPLEVRLRAALRVLAVQR